MAIKAKIYNCRYKCIKPDELKRTRKESGLTLAEVTARINGSGWAWNHNRLFRYEHGEDPCHLHPDEMQALLSALGATSI